MSVNLALQSIRLNWDEYDNYGSASEAGFQCAFSIHRNFGVHSVPEEWEYNAPMGPEEPDTPMAEDLDECKLSELIEAGNIMNRLLSQYKLAGLDY